MCPKDLIAGRCEDQALMPKMPLSRFSGISLFAKNTLTGTDPLPKS